MPLYPLDRNQLELPRLDLAALGTRFLNPGELECIVALMRTVKPRAVLETGVNTGRTAKVILANVPGIGSYVGVDVLPGYVTAKEVQRKEVPEDAGVLVKNDKRVLLLIQKHGSHDLSPEDIGPIDAAFIDGDHSLRGVFQDTWLAVSNIRPGGIIIWHDFHDLGTVDVRPALEGLSKVGWPIQFVVGTWLAFTRIPAQFDEAARKALLDSHEAVSNKISNLSPEKQA